jgi:type I restriction enzyme M protein
MEKQNLSSLIWSTADDVLRGLFKPSEYGRIILPFVVLRRLDCVLEPQKDKAFELHEKYKKKLKDFNKVIQSQLDLPFFNVSKFDLLRIKSDPNNAYKNFNNYIQGFSKNVLDIIENFQIDPLVTKLNKNKKLYLLIDKFTEFNLHPSKVDNHMMGSVYEELLRKFSEMSNEESGDHFTPRDIVKLLVSLVFSEDKKELSGEGKIRSVYDPCCGTGGMLSIGKEWVQKNINKKLKLELFGQELNDVTYSICKSDFLMAGENPENIKGPLSSLSDDKFQDRKFDYMITNPPFGTSWKSEEDFIKQEAKDAKGRFLAGIPKTNDGSFLFLQHLISKMEPSGSRIGIIFNNSPNQSGDAGSSESEIRKWLIGQDLIETIIGLPNQMFFNTKLRTYIWILSNKKKGKRKNKIQLIDCFDYFERMRKYLGEKGKYLTDNHINLILNLYKNFEETNESKIFAKEDFRYYKIETFNFSKDKNKIDKETKQVDYVSSEMGIEKYMSEKILPKDPSRIVLKEKTKIGYEIPFIKTFYKIPTLRNPELILEEIKKNNEKINDLNKEQEFLSDFISTTNTFINTNEVEDIDKLPKHWEVKELREVINERSKKVSDKEYEPLSVTKNGIFKQLDDVVVSDDHGNRKLVLKGDYVINSRSDRKGSSGLSNFDGSVSLINIVLEIKFKIDNQYFEFFMKSHWFKEIFFKYGNGIHEDLWSTRITRLKLLKLYFPKIEIQKIHSKFLEKEKKIKNELIDIYSKLIDLQNEHYESIKHNLIIGKKFIKNEFK